MDMQETMENSRVTRDIVIGMGDGLTVSFAVVAGLSVVFSESAPIFLVGLAVTFVQGLAMGLSGWFSGKGEQKYYFHELSKINDPDGYRERELQEQLKFYESMEFPAEMRNPALIEIDENNKQWVEFLQRFDLGPAEPGSNEPTKSAWTIGSSYLIGGLIPILSYYFLSIPADAIIYSIMATLGCLFILGFFKSKLTGTSPFSMAFNVMMTGAVAALCTYAIGFFFK